MWEKLQEIIGSIEVRELESRTLLEVFLNASNHRDADQIMRAKGFNSSTTFCQEYRALHLLCQSAIHYASDLHLALDTALRNAQQALEGFRYQ
ncbi:MAG: hypothetical protein RMJ60_09480, partial [Anaerolineales bacterium]|nr:hypothetical protein [Anaerolineales bacterium]